MRKSRFRLSLVRLLIKVCSKELDFRFVGFYFAMSGEDVLSIELRGEAVEVMIIVMCFVGWSRWDV